MKASLKVSIIVFVSVITIVVVTLFINRKTEVLSLFDNNVEALCDQTPGKKCYGPKEYHFVVQQFYCKCENAFECHDLSGCF